jgi:RND family efflux transporter MFP subunit
VLARLDPTEVEAAFRQSKEASIKAERDLERTRKLVASGALAPIELQNAETAMKLTEAGTDAAAFNASRSTIVAPEDGRIDKRFVESGEVVAPGRPVFHLSGQSKGAVVRFGVSDRDVLRIHEGDDARVVLDARPTQVILAKVSQVATVATPGAGTFDVEVKIPSSEAVLSGLTAKVEIAHAEEVGAVVPAGAVVFGSHEDAAVFVAQDGTHAKRVPVKVAFLDGERIALVSPLDGKVVDTGASRLDDGARVRIVP